MKFSYIFMDSKSNDILGPFASKADFLEKMCSWELPAGAQIYVWKSMADLQAFADDYYCSDADEDKKNQFINRFNKSSFPYSCFNNGGMAPEDWIEFSNCDYEMATPDTLPNELISLVEEMHCEGGWIKEKKQKELSDVIDNKNAMSMLEILEEYHSFPEDFFTEFENLIEEITCIHFDRDDFIYKNLCEIQDLNDILEDVIYIDRSKKALMGFRTGTFQVVKLQDIEDKFNKKIAV